MKIRFLFIWLCIMSLETIGQHQPITTQYMNHGLLVNPAIAGSRNDLFTTFSYRTQWIGNKFAPKTILLSSHAPLKNEKLAIGIQAYRDDVYFMKKTGLGAFGSYRIIKNDKMLSFGLKLGLYESKSNVEDLELIKENDPNFSENYRSLKPGIGTGVYYKTNSYYLGLAIPEMMDFLGNKVFSNTLNYNFIAGYKLHLKEDFDFIPNIQFRKVQAGKIQPDLTLLLRLKNKIDFGFITRSTKTIGVLASYAYDNRLQFTYSFDSNVSGISAPNTYGNHEIGVSYELKRVVETVNTKFF